MQELLKDILQLAKNMLPSINAPYIEFDFIKATPALILFMVYVLVLIIVYWHDVKNNKVKLQLLLWSSYSEGRKKSIIRAMGSFVVGCAVCWIVPPFFTDER